MLFECEKNTAPKWWAAMTFFAPITTPYFLFKTRKESGAMLVGIFMAVFSLVSGIEFYLYTNYMEKNKYAHLPPVTRQMIALSENVKNSTVNLDKALIRLENLSKVESRINEIKHTVEFIQTLRVIMDKNQDAIHKLIKHTEIHKEYFAKQDLTWVYNIQKFYNNRNVLQHHKSLHKYLDAFEELLKYTFHNFVSITEHKSPKHLKNYDEYYIRYSKAVASHNRFNVKRISFQNKYLKKYPDIKSYLPGERQTDTFRLWE